ncbi:MAG: type II toxin-antitoxin system prevent-host-death family antitoxin [Actinobacteria bacterium]|nr:MAG: type II toxin-antitoxin system prevent-host-death family antitoxin [Actinomycetota bacterium]
MGITVNVHEAKTRLSELLARAEQGEEVVIARAGTAVARLTPVAAPPRRAFGGFDVVFPDAFFAVLDEQELAAWE